MCTTKSTRFIFTATALAASLAATHAAQAVPSWDRHVEAIAVTAEPGGSYRIRAEFSVEADGISSPTNLGTRVMFLVNGSVIASPVVAITGSPAGSGGCGISCATFQPCICGEIDGDVVCFCSGGFVANTSTGASLHPGDEVTVILRPAPGAMPDSSAVADVLTFEFDGELVFWNRSLTSLAITPVSGSSSVTHQISAQLHARYQGPLLDPMDLSTNVQLFRNGSPIASQDVQITVNPQPAVAGGAVPCGGSCPWHLFCYCGGSLDCTCGEFIFAIVFPGHFTPGDEITVILHPAMGRLPELPSLTADDIVTAIVPGAPSPADLNHDGVVNSLDLGIMLSNWSIPVTAPGCGGITPCGADLNHDGRVNTLDLGMMLAAWTM